MSCIETNKFDDWQRFGGDAIGMHLDEMSPTIRFRLDANECRVLLTGAGGRRRRAGLAPR